MNDEIDRRALLRASEHYGIPATNAADRRFLRDSLAYQSHALHLSLVALGWAVLDAFRIPQLAAWLDRRLSKTD